LHFNQRSAAVARDDAGISLTNLKRAGRWASAASAEEYLEHSNKAKSDRMNMLDPGPGKGEESELWDRETLDGGYDAQPSQESIGSSIVSNSGSSGSSGNTSNGVFGPKSEKTKQQRRSEQPVAEAVGSYAPYGCSSAAKQTHLGRSEPAERFGPSAISESASTFPNFLKNELDGFAKSPLNFSDCTFNFGNMTTENRQFQPGLPPTHVHTTSTPLRKPITIPYFRVQKPTTQQMTPTRSVYNPYAKYKTTKPPPTPTKTPNYDSDTYIDPTWFDSPVPSPSNTPTPEESTSSTSVPTNYHTTAPKTKKPKKENPYKKATTCAKNNNGNTTSQRPTQALRRSPRFSYAKGFHPGPQSDNCS